MVQTIDHLMGMFEFMCAEDERELVAGRKESAFRPDA